MATRERKDIANLGDQAIALAEQLGRLAGTIEGSAEAWLTRQKLTEQLARIREHATKMLEGLAEGVSAGRNAQKAADASKSKTDRSRPDDPARAPGKRRRKPAPALRGTKKSDLSIPKLRAAKAVRQRRKSHA